MSLDLVAERTGLPVAHVEALEQGRIDELPSGPYVQAYYRLVLGVVGGEEIHEIQESSPAEPEGLPLWVVRGVAIASVALLLVIVVVQVRQLGLEDVEALTGVLSGPSVEALPDVNVKVTARRESRFRVWSDGEPTFDGVLAPGVFRTFSASDRLEIELAGAEVAHIEYNGDPVVPQGRQGVPRRLIFIDDLSPGD